jgi:hypothetical protein
MRCPSCSGAMAVSRKRGLHVCSDPDCGVTVPLEREAGLATATVPLGRRAHAAALMEAAEAARRGRPAFVLLEGEAGAGKSTLVRFLYETFAAASYDPDDYWPDRMPDFEALYAPDARERWASMQAPWLWLAAHATSERQVRDPLSSWRKLLPQVDAHVLQGDGRAKAKALGLIVGEAALDLGLDLVGFGALKLVAETGKKMFDVFRGRGATAVECDRAQLEAVKRSICHVLHAVSATVPGREEKTGLFTILVFEDLHWATRESLDLLLELLHGEKGPRKLLVVATQRPVDARTHEHGLSDVLHRLERYAGDAFLYRKLAVANLGESEARTLVAERLPAAPADLATWIASLTGGNPLFVVEFCRLLVDRGEVGPDGALAPSVTLDQLRSHVRAGALPGRVDAVIAERFERLAKAQRQLLEFASASGRRFHEAYLRRALEKVGAGSEIDRLRLELSDLERVHELVAASAARAGDFEFEFTHALFHAAADRRLSGPLRATCLAALAESILDRLDEDGWDGREGLRLELLGRFVEVVAGSDLRATGNEWKQWRARAMVERAELSDGVAPVADRLAWTQEAIEVLRALPSMPEREADLVEALAMGSALHEASDDHAAAAALDAERVSLVRGQFERTQTVDAFGGYADAAASLAEHLGNDGRDGEATKVLTAAVREARALLERTTPSADSTTVGRVLVVLLSQLGRTELDVDPDKNDRAQWKVLDEARALLRALPDVPLDRRLDLLRDLAIHALVNLKQAMAFWGRERAVGVPTDAEDAQRAMRKLEGLGAEVRKLLAIHGDGFAKDDTRDAAEARRGWTQELRHHAVLLAFARGERGAAALLRRNLDATERELSLLASRGAAPAAVAAATWRLLRFRLDSAELLLDNAEPANLALSLVEAALPEARRAAEEKLAPDEDALVEALGLRARAALEAGDHATAAASARESIAVARRKRERVGAIRWASEGLMEALATAVGTLHAAGAHAEAAVAGAEALALALAATEDGREPSIHLEDVVGEVIASALASADVAGAARLWRTAGQVAQRQHDVRARTEPAFAAVQRAGHHAALLEATIGRGVVPALEVAALVDEAIAGAAALVSMAVEDVDDRVASALYEVVLRPELLDAVDPATGRGWTEALARLTGDLVGEGAWLALPPHAHALATLEERFADAPAGQQLDALDMGGFEAACDDAALYRDTFADAVTLQALARWRRVGWARGRDDDRALLDALAGAFERTTDDEGDCDWTPCSETRGMERTLRELFEAVAEAEVRGAKARAAEREVFVAASVNLAILSANLFAEAVEEGATLAQVAKVVGAKLGLNDPTPLRRWLEAADG